MTETTGRYTRIAMLLHWLVAVLILVNLAVVWTVNLGWWPDALVRPAIDTHKSIGMTVLGLALLRVLWRLSHRPPSLPRSYPWLERAGAHAAHALLYVLIVGLPLSGYIHDSAWKDGPTHPDRWFGLFTWPRLGYITAMDPAAKERVHTVWFQVHGALAYALYALLALHVLGALKHQFLDGEAEFGRMLPWGARRTSRAAILDAD